jgi:hypothetical protein
MSDLGAHRARNAKQQNKDPGPQQTTHAQKMSKPNCPDGTCPLVNNDDAKSDAGSDVTGRTGKSGKSGHSGRSDKSNRSGRSDKSDRSGKSDKSDRSGRSDKSGRSGRSDKSGRSGKSDKSDRSGKSDKSGRSGRSDRSAGSAAAANQPDSVHSLKESMMNDGASQSGSIAGSDAAPPPPTCRPKKPAKRVTFAATGHIEGDNVVMQCKPSSCGHPRHVKCIKFE